MKNEVKITGIGVHSGRAANLRIYSQSRAGIFFRRTDLQDARPMPAVYSNVYNTALQNTIIGECPDCVQTIEHLMAALSVCGIYSAAIDIDGPETPILDGSAAEFIKKLQKFQNSFPAKKIIVKREVIAHRRELIRKLPLIRRMKLFFYNLANGRREDGFVKLSPDPRGLCINATLDYPDKIIGRQSAEFLLDYSEKSKKDFVKNFASARTFGRISEWEYLKARGMGLGANENNVIVLNAAGDGTLNRLRWPDEFVRHKIIDAIGDMATAGGQVYGKLTSVKGSHGLNNLALRKLFSNPENYDII
ncbi:MAG: UDP-3-O-acyl-N-acetylglucosamine deacetylase [Rickettsiales bacterium]|jgi:UDP-3-O-[3-hydroxymyristoyl] N-acetylglucosamine deacetylase|nr:UDP-3-O-acyl-N-acetylglucosamine deacetylase [Rickettsiales bacterium]